MKSNKLIKLKRLLQTATDLKEPSEYFWEELASDPAFMSAGKFGMNPRLQIIIEHAARHALGGEQTASMLMLRRIPKFKFWHGSCVFGSKMSQVVYFDDIDQGLLTILENPMTGMTHYVRISTVQVEGAGGAVPVNPRKTPSA
jgi:hypothetical protein